MAAAMGKVPSDAMTKMPSNDDLRKKGSQLKHVTTKEYSGEPSEDETQAIKKIWDEKSSNPKALATHFEIDSDLLMDNMPDNVGTFAKNLFAGLYTQDKDEAAKDRFRQRLVVELKRTSSKLRKSVTRESTGPSEEDLASAVKIYNDNKGDLKKIAVQLKLEVSLLTSDPPVSAQNFAQKLFAGNYTPEADEVAKQKLREVLRSQIIRIACGLKKTTTKEGLEELDQEDPNVVMAKKLYPGKNVKEIEAIAQNLGLSAAHMKSDLGVNAADFANKLLSGAYTADKAEVAKAAMRTKLEAAIKERRPSLNQVRPQRRMSDMSDDMCMNFSAFFTRRGGDLDAIAAESGLPIAALRANPPHNAADFVLKLMDGSYTVEMDEQAKATLRACMRQEIRRTSKLLKKASTSEWDGKANEEDVKLIAAAYTQRNGDLKYLASKFSLNIPALEAKPPKDADDFAKNVLLGNYQSA